MKRVLIVDDEKWICSVLQDFLEESGYAVQTSMTLSGAREKIDHEALPDVVVLDMTLPDGNGASLMDEIRANDRTKDIPIIMITANSSQITDNALAGRKPDDCIIKPFNLSDFKTCLDHHLKASPN